MNEKQCNSQGSVETHLRCGGNFYTHFVEMSFFSSSKQILKNVYIQRSYCENLTLIFLRHTVHYVDDRLLTITAPAKVHIHQGDGRETQLYVRLRQEVALLHAFVCHMMNILKIITLKCFSRTYSVLGCKFGDDRANASRFGVLNLSMFLHKTVFWRDGELCQQGFHYMNEYFTYICVGTIAANLLEIALSIFLAMQLISLVRTNHAFLLVGRSNFFLKCDLYLLFFQSDT